MTFITHGFRVSVVSDVRERVRDIGSPLRFMLRRSSLVECVSVHLLMYWMSWKLPYNFQIHEHSWPCLFHINRQLLLDIK
jgi:hypothetical protein